MASLNDELEWKYVVHETEQFLRDHPNPTFEYTIASYLDVLGEYQVRKRLLMLKAYVV